MGGSVYNYYTHCFCVLAELLAPTSSYERIRLVFLGSLLTPVNLSWTLELQLGPSQKALIAALSIYLSGPK